MAINKVIYGKTTLMDLTSDTVTADTMLKGVTAHNKAGNVVTGKLTSTVSNGVLTIPTAIGSVSNSTLTMK